MTAISRPAAGRTRDSFQNEVLGAPAVAPTRMKATAIAGSLRRCEASAVAPQDHERDEREHGGQGHHHGQRVERLGNEGTEPVGGLDEPAHEPVDGLVREIRDPG